MLDNKYKAKELAFRYFAELSIGIVQNWKTRVAAYNEKTLVPSKRLKYDRPYFQECWEICKTVGEIRQALIERSLAIHEPFDLDACIQDDLNRVLRKANEHYKFE